MFGLPNPSVLAQSALRHALAERLSRSSCSTLVVVASDCPTAECQLLVSEGRDVIVLANTPDPEEERAYRTSGAAAYLPLSIDTQALLAAIELVEDARAKRRNVIPFEALSQVASWGQSIHW